MNDKKTDLSERNRQSQLNAAPRRGLNPNVSANCRNGKHSRCFSVGCGCRCGHGVSNTAPNGSGMTQGERKAD